MLIDTHCHLNIMVKDSFDSYLTDEECQKARDIVNNARQADVQLLICVGTSLIESSNCVRLAREYSSVYATVGIHPNDATEGWQRDFDELKKYAQNAKNNKVVGIGECGIDTYYPGYNMQRQRDVFRAHIELALACDLALIVHTRQAAEETYACLEEFKGQGLRGIIHCFSDGLDFGRAVTDLGFAVGVGGTITYPKNNELRKTIETLGINRIVLETDAPFLPPQPIRGQKNTPAQVATVAFFLSDMLGITPFEVAERTSHFAQGIFRIVPRDLENVG